MDEKLTCEIDKFPVASKQKSNVLNETDANENKCKETDTSTETCVLCECNFYFFL